MLDELLERFRRRDRNALARLLTLVARGERVDEILAGVPPHPNPPPQGGRGQLGLPPPLRGRGQLGLPPPLRGRGQLGLPPPLRGRVGVGGCPAWSH